MFRLKIGLLYFLAIALIVATMCVYINVGREQHFTEVLTPSLEASAESYAVNMEYKISKLKEYTKDLLKSDLPEYMQILKDNKKAIRDMSTRIREELGWGKTGQGVIRFVEDKGKDVLDGIEKRIQTRIKKQPEVAGGYAKHMKEIFASCMAEVEPWDVCFYKVTYIPLTSIIFPEQKKVFTEHFPEFFALIDSDGKTARLLFDNLDSSVDKLKFADLDKAGTEYASHRHKNFDQVVEVIQQLPRSIQPPVSSYVLLENNRAFIVVASRIESEVGDFLGAILVGYELGRGRAMIDTLSVMGVRPTLRKCLIDAAHTPNDANPNERLCEFEMLRQDRGISYFVPHKTRGLVRSGTSLRDDKAEAVSNMVRQGRSTSDHLANASVVIPIDFAMAKQPVEAILTMDLDIALGAFHDQKVALFIVAFFVFVIGLVFILWFIQSHIKPFGQIDRGIHEIINGNFDYSFPFNFPEKLPSSMAQSLCIMKAVLLGQPLPEDVQRDDSWAESLKIAEAEDLQEQFSQDEPGSGGKGIAPPCKESENDYYRRLYTEYIGARRSLGQDISGITFIKFKEKVAKTEADLEARLKSGKVLFKVLVKDKQVVLHPLRCSEGSDRQDSAGTNHVEDVDPGLGPDKNG